MYLKILKVKQTGFFLGCLLVILGTGATVAQAEYRAYYMQVYDKILNNTWEVITGFTPKNYLASIRKGSEVKVLIKASWLCRGDTSFQQVCPAPTPVAPKFKVGEQVVIRLPKHLTNLWQGVIEFSLWREDLQSNIYGVRFPAQGYLYGSYYEAHLDASVRANLGANVSVR